MIIASQQRDWNMNLQPLSRIQVRDVDRIAIEQYGIPGIVLMENAGRGAAEIIDRVAPQGRIVILTGGGNNGGDGYVIARHLELAERPVRIVSVVPIAALRGDAKINAEIASRSEIDLRVVTEGQPVAPYLADAATVVDCLLGTGAGGSPRGLFATAVESANAKSDCHRIAIDIPTGLDCDSGVAHEPTFRADATITFVAPKLGFQKNNAGTITGVVHVVGIGVPRRLLEQL